MAQTEEIIELLVEAKVLPAAMLHNYTFDRVREILDELVKYDLEKLREALAVLLRQEITGPLASTIFIKNHLKGTHDVEIDRLAANEETGQRYAILVYPEGEVAVKTERLPKGVKVGSHLRYEPARGQYLLAAKQ